MLSSFRNTVFSIAFTLATLISFGQASVLNTGNWFKLSIEKPGVYKISYDQLKNMGANPGSINPRNLKLFGLKGGMLPQVNSVQSENLTELSIIVHGEDDGKFNSGDYILFYGEGPDQVSFVHQKETFLYESNLYAKKNYVFLTVASTPGKRIPTTEALSGGASVNTFNDFIYHELDESNLLTSGREWYGEYFFLTTEYSLDFAIPGIADGTPMRFISDIVGASFASTSMEIFLNGALLREVSLPTITNSSYAPKGKHRRDTTIVNSSTVNAASRNDHTVKFNFKKAASGTSKAYLDFFLLSFERKLALYGDQTRFRSLSSLNGSTRFKISAFPSNGEVWNITDALNPVKQVVTKASDVGEFTAPDVESVQEYIVFNTSFLTPSFVEKVKNQNLSGTATPDFIIVTATSLLEQAERLAAHRNSRGTSTIVVSTDEIFNEFSSGRQDVSSIRNFIRHHYTQGPGKLKAVLFFGRGSYDYKNRLADNTNLVPTYESRNSLSPLETYSSDDYFSFLETGEGEWRESPIAQNHTVDIGIGRLPVKSATEAKNIVDKIIAYESNIQMIGAWRKQVVFIADDGSNSDGFTSIHQAQANTMAETIESIFPSFNTRKIFLGTYKKTVTPTGEIIPDASEDIQEEFGNALIINYTGHGSEKVLADEDIITRDIVRKLKNKTYPFLVTATCEFGRHDDPEHISTAEECVLLANAGAIGMVTTARPVNSSTNFSLNQAFYEALFQRENERYLPLGEIFRRTKNESMSGVANRNFSLLGDPMLRLAMPELKVSITSMKTTTDSDVLKALSHVIVKGEIQDVDGTVVENFNGTLQAVLFDKRTEFTTIGKNDPAYEFEEWFNPLFKGKASVLNGVFEFDFILPKNIAYDVDAGKLSVYAADPTTGRDATGSSGEFEIGGSEPNPVIDNQSPQLLAYMGDASFKNGGVVPASTKLVVKITDESGINISNYGIGNTLMAILDNDEEVYLLNEHFIADTDSYKSGWVDYPLYNLTPGKHTLTIKAWDTHNNPGQAQVEFVVGEGGYLQIEDFGTFPNPFATSTTLFFTHNRSGEDLEGDIIILNMAGQEIKRMAISQPTSPYEVQIPIADVSLAFGKKLPPGIYFARLSVRSISDGSKSDRVAKLIVVN